MRAPSLPVDKKRLLATWPFFSVSNLPVWNYLGIPTAGFELTVHLRLLVRFFRSVGPVAVTVAFVVVRVIEMALFNGV